MAPLAGWPSRPTDYADRTLVAPPPPAPVAARKRVAVVGAGPSGLATVKELLEEGHEPTCYERAAGLGGVFRFDEDTGAVWESCRLTSSGLMTAFSDFPVPAEKAGHMTVGEYVAYLERYCAAFGVHRCLRFGTAVESIASDGDGGWRVGTVGPDGSSGEERFDAVAVCSGLHQHAHAPEFRGQESFPGEILHGARYRRPAQVTGKRVLIVGAGESGADIVAEVSEHAAETVVSLRRGVAVLPRMIRGHPNDYRTCRINNAAAPWIFETRNPDDAWKRNLYRTAFLPLVIVDKLVQASLGLADRLQPWSTVLRGGAVAEARRAARTRQLTRQLLRRSGGTLQEQFGTKSDDWVKAIVTGRCRQAGPIERFEGARAVFEEGADFAPDLVVLCTGFETRTPFLDPRLATAPRYMHTFAPTVGVGLAFIGFVRPSFGTIPRGAPGAMVRAPPEREDRASA